MDETLHLNEFFVEGGNQTTSHVLLHLTEPSTPEEKEKGYFFAIAELNDASTEIITNVQSLIDDIENAYYETEDKPNKTALEIVIASFNAATTLTEQTKGKMHCLVGALRGEEILLTYTGNPLTTLFYKNRQGSYQPMDLLEGTNAAEDDSQLFQQFVQGKIGVNDFLLLGTPHITDHFNRDRLEKIITTRSSEESAEHLERVLNSLRNEYSYGGLIINRVAAQASPTKKPRPEKPEITSAESLRHLLSTERNTSETLSPSFIPRVQERLKQSLAPKPAPVRTTQPEPATAVTVRAPHLQTHRARPRSAPAFDTRDITSKILPAVGTFFRTVLLGITYFVQFLWLLVLSVVRFFGALFFILTNAQGRRRTILENWIREWRARKENFKQLSIFTKIALFAIVVGCTALVIGIMAVRHSQKVAAAEKAFADAVAVIDLKHEAAESALIYRDENKANAELQSALSLLNSLPCDAKENITTCRELTNKLSDLTIRLSKRTPVTGTVLTSWNENIQFSNLIKLGTKLIALTSSTSRLYMYDVIGKETTSVETGFVAGTITNITAPKENDYAVAIVNQKDLYLLDPTDWHLRKADVTFPNPVSKLTSAVVYNRRLYSLDAGANHLYKHDAIKNGFGVGKDWFAEGTNNISSATDVTIDGDVYILGTDGTVQKFLSGTKIPWSLPTIDPPLTAGSRIYTYNDVENLYILDTTGKRLLILSKEGTLKAQLVDPKWVNPTDVVVDEPAYVAYVADGNKLYKIDLPR